MKKWGRFISVLVLCLILVGTVACNATAGQKDVSSRLAKVTRGNLVVSVNGSGNIEVANESKLAFGVNGKIDKIYVDEGDKVKKGDVLISLETDDMELALSQSETAQKQAEVAVSQAEVSLRQAMLSKTQAEVAQTQAEAALQLAQFDLDRMDDVKKIKDKIEEGEQEQQIAEANLKLALATQAEAVHVQNWTEQVNSAKQKILDNQQKLADLLSKDEYATLAVTEVKIKALQVQVAQQTVQQTKETVQLAELNMTQTQRNIELSKKSLDHADKALEYTRKQLDKATITAPFDALVVSVNVEEGDTIPSPTVAPKVVIHLIDPTSLELKVDVDEIDVPSVKVGQKALISVDALPDTEFEGKVTYISPLPTPQAGVVLYRVTVSFQVSPTSQLKVGMSASADIILNERKDVLLVPSRAVYQNEHKQSVVKVMVGQQAEERVVVTGITDGFDTEIVSGLNEGETIVVETKITPASSGGFFG